MEFVFPWPTSQGEWLAFMAAGITVFFGLMLLFAPGMSFRLLRLQTLEHRPQAIAEGRARMAGFYLGTGLTAILFAQPMIYLVLMAGWGFTAFGRIVSMLSDRGNTPYNWAALIVEATLAGMAAVYALGIIP